MKTGISNHQVLFYNHNEKLNGDVEGDWTVVNSPATCLQKATRHLYDLIVISQKFRLLNERFALIELFLPPLRERPEDIPLIAEHYLSKFAAANRKEVRAITPQALDALQAYPWIGNIRELINVIERGTILSGKDCLYEKDLPSHIANYRSNVRSSNNLRSLVEAEKSHIKEVLLHTDSIEEAARVLDIDPTTLWRKRKKYHLVETNYFPSGSIPIRFIFLQSETRSISMILAALVLFQPAFSKTHRM